MSAGVAVFVVIFILAYFVFSGMNYYQKYKYLIKSTGLGLAVVRIIGVCLASLVAMIWVNTAISQRLIPAEIPTGFIADIVGSILLSTTGLGDAIETYSAAWGPIQWWVLLIVILVGFGIATIASALAVLPRRRYYAYAVREQVGGEWASMLDPDLSPKERSLEIRRSVAADEVRHAGESRTQMLRRLERESLERDKTDAAVSSKRHAIAAGIMFGLTLRHLMMIGKAVLFAAFSALLLAGALHLLNWSNSGILQTLVTIVIVVFVVLFMIAWDEAKPTTENTVEAVANSVL